MARKPTYTERKTRATYSLTPTATAVVEAIAQQSQLSASEAVERLIRGTVKP